MRSLSLASVCTYTFVLFAALGTTSHLHAQAKADAHAVAPGETGTEAQDSSYEAELDRALKAHANGDLDTARQAMERAHSLHPNARTFRGLGVIALAQGQPRTAARFLEASLTDERLPLTETLRTSVKDLLVQCFQRMGRVHAHLTPASAELRIDDEKPQVEKDGEYWLAPGEHRFEVRAEGYAPYRFEERVDAGTLESLHVVLKSIPEEAVAVTPRSLTPAVPPMQVSPNIFDELSESELDPETLRQERRRRAQWGLFAGGAHLGAIAFATWLTARVRYGDIQDKCADGCSQQQVNDMWDNKKINPLRRAAMGVGAAAGGLLLLSGGLYLWKWRGERREARLGVTGTGLAFTLRH